MEFLKHLCEGVTLEVVGHMIAETILDALNV